MRYYPKEWLEDSYLCEYCRKPYSEHESTWFKFKGIEASGLCNGRKSDFKPILPIAIDCDCEGWTFDDDVAALWPEGQDGHMSGHHPGCFVYEPPPTVQLTIDKLERRVKRLKEYLK